MYQAKIQGDFDGSTLTYSALRLIRYTTSANETPPKAASFIQWQTKERPAVPLRSSREKEWGVLTKRMDGPWMVW